MEDSIQIKTGARISNILQSTVTYEQAFTELVKNSMQSGATFVDITLNADSVVVIDNGIGFDHEADENGMTGFEKYFVFGNSYDMSNGSGPTLGHMGIGGKIANDKLSDSNNTLWTIETKNQKGKSFLVTYQPGKTEFLDDYAPGIIELSESTVTTDHGTIVTISNLDLPIIKNGWNSSRIRKELQDFFGYLVRNGEKEFNIVLNGESLQFDYTLPGYLFPEMNKEFTFEHEDELKTGNIKFNLSLMQNQYDIDVCPLDSVIIVSDVKVCSLTLDKEELIKKIYEEISEEIGKNVVPQKSVRNLFAKLRGFIVSSELSEVLDHTGMPAKDLSHHALREDHPVTSPFYEVVYKTIIDLLRGYLLLNIEQNTNRIGTLANNVVKFIAKEIDIDQKLLVDLGINTEELSTAEGRMLKVKVAEDTIGTLIKAEIDNKTKNKKRRRRKIRALRKTLLEKYKENPESIPAKLKEVDNGPLVEDETGVERTVHDSKGIRYEIKPFGSGKEKIMSEFETENNFCVYINSENYKFNAIKDAEDNLGLALHIAESIIRELTRYANPLASKNEIDESLSDFYKQSYAKLRAKNLFE